MTDNQVLCQLTIKPKANVSCQLKFWPFVSFQLTPSTPSLQCHSIVAVKQGLFKKGFLTCDIFKETAKYLKWRYLRT